MENNLKIQISGSGGGQVSPEMSVDDFIDGTPKKLGQLADGVKHVTEAFFEKLEKLDSKPKACSIEFGVNVGGEAGVPFVTKGTVGANFKVALKWEF